MARNSSQCYYIFSHVSGVTWLVIKQQQNAASHTTMPDYNSVWFGLCPAENIKDLLSVSWCVAAIVDKLLTQTPPLNTAGHFKLGLNNN